MNFSMESYHVFDRTLPNSCYGKCWSDEMKKNMSIIQKKKWEDKEWVKRRIEAYHFSPNKTESIIRDFICEYGYDFVGDDSFWIGYPPINPDFINREKRKIVEIFGDFFHREEDEKNRINHYKKYGWETVVIWCSELSLRSGNDNLSDGDKSFILSRLSGSI